MPTDTQLDPLTCVCLSCDGFGYFPDGGVVLDKCKVCNGTGKLTKERLMEIVGLAENWLDEHGQTLKDL